MLMKSVQDKVPSNIEAYLASEIFHIKETSEMAQARKGFLVF